MTKKKYVMSPEEKQERRNFLERNHRIEKYLANITGTEDGQHRRAKAFQHFMPTEGRTRPDINKFYGYTLS